MDPNLIESSFVLERLVTGINKSLGRYCASNLKVETFVDAVTRDLVVKLTTELLATKRITNEQTYTVEIPKTWWDHLKLSLPAWTHRWVGKPVYDTVVLSTKFSEYATYPKINVDPVPASFGPQVTVHGWQADISDIRWKVTPGVGEKIPNPYLTYAEVYRALEYELAANSSSPYGVYTWDINSFLKALGKLGLNVSEMIPR